VLKIIAQVLFAVFFIVASLLFKASTVIPYVAPSFGRLFAGVLLIRRYSSCFIIIFFKNRSIF